MRKIIKYINITVAACFILLLFIINTKSREELLFLAIENNNLKEVKTLLEKGVDLSVQNNKGNTPLNEAVFKGHTEVIRLLLDNGVSANYVDNNGRTPLLIAATHGHIETVKL
ncbi:MAG: ankyrin repeat domain-containing protein [Wolbachia pipientis]